jgi:hypothetical protein
LIFSENFDIIYIEKREKERKKIEQALSDKSLYLLSIVGTEYAANLLESNLIPLVLKKKNYVKLN